MPERIPPEKPTRREFEKREYAFKGQITTRVPFIPSRGDPGPTFFSLRYQEYGILVTTKFIALDDNSKFVRKNLRQDQEIIVVGNPTLFIDIECQNGPKKREWGIQVSAIGLL